MMKIIMNLKTLSYNDINVNLLLQFLFIKMNSHTFFGKVLFLSV